MDFFLQVYVSTDYVTYGVVFFAFVLVFDAFPGFAEGAQPRLRFNILTRVPLYFGFFLQVYVGTDYVTYGALFLAFVIVFDAFPGFAKGAQPRLRFDILTYPGSGGHNTPMVCQAAAAMPSW